MYEIFEDETLPSAFPGEKPSPTQPRSAVAFTRQKFEITRRSKEATEFVENVIKDLDMRPYAPPSVMGSLIFPAYDGGAEWGGSAFDPNRNRLILNAQEIGGIIRLFEIPSGFSGKNVYPKHCALCHGQNLAGAAAGPSLIGITERLARISQCAVLARTPCGVKGPADEDVGQHRSWRAAWSGNGSS